MLEMILGTDLYNEIDGQLFNSLTGANDTLYQKCKKFLAWQAYQFWLPKANFKSTRAGIRVHREDNSDPANAEEMATLIRDAKMWAQTQKEKIVQFLEDNSTTYPMYDVNCGNNKRTGTGFHITPVGTHRKGCKCDLCCHGYS